MWKFVLLYGFVLGLAAFALEWLEYKYLTRVFAPEVYVLALAIGFTALGIFVGRRLTVRAPTESFVRNEKAIASLGITAREFEALERLAAGDANKEIARAMGVTPNTIKSHLAKLYAKLDAVRRTDAVAKARALGIIP